MVVVDQLCQAYHWTYQDAMRRTMPQIIMLNHAAWVNGKHMGLGDDSDSSDYDAPVHKGKRLSEMDSEDYRSYYSDWTM